MTRRRKNAGKGFGMMFHGAFGSKEDAKRKERQVHGFIQPRNIKGKRRFVVMSERKNPIRRKKKNKNPMDLVVMGANPHAHHNAEHEETEHHELHVKPGDTITLKLNPSSAAQIREEFIGGEPERILIFDEPHMPKGDYSKLGDLMGITFKPVHGGQVQAIGYYVGSETVPLHEAAKSLRTLTEAPLLVSDESRRQLYFVQGNQNLDRMLEFVKAERRDSGLWELGEARDIVYRERKAIEEFRLVNWEHKFGEENGIRPVILYDETKQRLLLEGGDYEVRPEGIVN